MIVMYLVLTSTVALFQVEAEAIKAAEATKGAKIVGVECAVSCPALASPWNLNITPTNYANGYAPPSPNNPSVSGCRLVGMEIAETPPQKILRRTP